MKYQKIIFFIAVLLFLVACSDPEKQQSQPTAVAPTQHLYIKVAKDCPSNIPSQLTLIGGACHLDTINNQPTVDTNPVVDKTMVKLAGWAGNVAEGTSQQEVWIKFVGINSSSYVKAIGRKKRPDVATHFNKTGLADAGWEVYADLSELEAGDYEVEVVMIEGEGGFSCKTKRIIQIR